MRERIHLADRETVLNINKEVIRNVPVADGEIIEVGDSVFMDRNYEAYKNEDLNLDPILAHNSFIHHAVLLDQWVIGDRVFTLSKSQHNACFIDFHVYRVNQEKEMHLGYSHKELIPTATSLGANSIERTHLSDDKIQISYYENSSVILRAINLTRDLSGNVIAVNVSDPYIMTEQLNYFRLEKTGTDSFLLAYRPSGSFRYNAHIRYCSWVEGELIMGEYSDCFEANRLASYFLVLHPLKDDKFVVVSQSDSTPRSLLLSVVDVTNGALSIGVPLIQDIGANTATIYHKNDFSFGEDKFCIVCSTSQGGSYVLAYKIDGLTITAKNKLSGIGSNHQNASETNKYNRNMKLAENVFIFSSYYGSSQNYYEGLWLFGFNGDTIEEIGNLTFRSEQGYRGSVSRYTSKSILWGTSYSNGNERKTINLSEVWLDEENQIQVQEIMSDNHKSTDMFRCQSDFGADYVEGIGTLNQIQYNYSERKGLSKTRSCLGIIGKGEQGHSLAPDLIGERIKLLKLGDKILLVYAGVMNHRLEGILLKQEGTSWVQEKHIKFPSHQKVCRYFDAILLDDETLVVGYTKNHVQVTTDCEAVAHTIFDISNLDMILVIGSEEIATNYLLYDPSNRIKLHRISDKQYIFIYLGIPRVNPQNNKSIYYYRYELTVDNSEILLSDNGYIKNSTNGNLSFDCVDSKRDFLIKVQFYSGSHNIGFYALDPQELKFKDITNLNKGSKSLAMNVWFNEGEVWSQSSLIVMEDVATDNTKLYHYYLNIKYYDTSDYRLLADKVHPINLPDVFTTGSDVFTLAVTETSFMKVFKNGDLYKGFLMSFDRESLSSHVEELHLGNNSLEAFTTALVPEGYNTPILLVASKNDRIETSVNSGILTKSALVLNRRINKHAGIAFCDGVEGEIDLITKGMIDQVYSNLIPGADYYVGKDGRPNLTPNDFYLGKALGKESLEIKGGT